MAEANPVEKDRPVPMVPEVIQPDFQFLEQLEATGPYHASACYQCRKCTNGCPVTFAMDLYPDEVIRLVILGQAEAVLHSHTIWVCAACITCTTRCPNEVKIAELMDGLKEMAVRKGIPCPQPQVLTLHDTFLRAIKKRGRMHEASFLPHYLLRSGSLRRKWQEGTLRDQLKLGWQLRRKGRLALRAKKISGQKEIRRILSRHPNRQDLP